MKYFIFVLLIPFITGGVTAAFGMGWFDGWQGVSLNSAIHLSI